MACGHEDLSHQELTANNSILVGDPVTADYSNFHSTATTPLKIHTDKDTRLALSGELSWDWKKALHEVFPSWDEYMNRRMGRLQKREQSTCWSTFNLVNLRWGLFTCFKPFQRLQRPQIVSQCIILFLCSKTGSWCKVISWEMIVEARTWFIGV